MTVRLFSRVRPGRTLPGVIAGCLVVAAAAAEEKDPRPAAGIQDNSFLIEEAYNQEANVVQHIQGLRRDGRDWFYTFTQEWPMGGQDNQFSYTVPYSWIRNEFGHRVHGLGDLFLNYRRQVWYESATMPAFTPRLSLIVPTGSQSKGLGDGSYGLEGQLAFSKIVSDRVTLHANAGLTHLFDVNGFSPTTYRLGASAIYAVSRDFNLMLENVAEWEQSVNSSQMLERQFSYTIAPGFRFALNYPALNDLQIVMGAALPIRFSRDETSYGAFFYLSFEHEYGKKK